MSFVQHTVNFQVPSQRDDWVKRMENVCEVLERLHPEEKLVYAIPYHENKPVVTIRDRKKYLKKQSRTTGRWLSINNGKCFRGRGGYTYDEGRLAIGWGSGGSFPEMNGFSIQFFHTTWDHCEQVISEVGDAVNAITSYYYPMSVNTYIGDQIKNNSSSLRELSELPGLWNCTYSGLKNICQPEAVGWINYWSKSTCKYLDIDVDELSSEYYKAYRTEKDACLLRLTKPPLDLADSTHLRILIAAFRNFPGVGVRTKNGPLFY